MDKTKVIDAYYGGLLTIGECEQILGMNRSQIFEIIESVREGHSAAWTHLKST